MRTGSPSPALSIILCSRNDQYMGDSRWRLRTSLDYLARNLQSLGRQADVEILVTDWGSDLPLSVDLELGPAAAALVRFLGVPPGLATRLQKDSPFAEVLALNAAARRASGQYIGRIDQDTLVGVRFLRTFFDLHEGKRRLDGPLSATLMFSGRRDIPYRFAVRRPQPWIVDRFIERRGASLPVEGAGSPNPFYRNGVGIWLAHRGLWQECGGYDERMIYMNGMEIDMLDRLMTKYPLVDLGAIVGHDFYHLEHYHPWEQRRSSAHRKVNVPPPARDLDRMAPNGEAWGLAAQDLPGAALSVRPPMRASPDSPALARAADYLILMLIVDVQGVCDRVFKVASTWRERACAVWRAAWRRPLRFRS